MRLLFAIVIALTTMPIDAAAQGRAVPEAEKTASRYMVAFFRGDLRAAASLTHPKTLTALKETFLAGESRAPTIADAELSELRKLDPEDFYVAVVEGDRKRNNAAVEVTKNAEVAVISSEELPGGSATVRLRITTPTPTSFLTQETGLVLRLSGNQWKVVENAQ